MKITDVAVAVLLRSDGSFLLSSRPTGKPYAGYWEFPGGKIEPGESVRDALRRELIEELNVVIDTCYPWFTFVMVYQHATVRLHTWRVTAWHDADAGGMHGREGQQFAWQTSVETIDVTPTLPGCVPIFRALSLPTRYLVTCTGECGIDTILRRLRALPADDASNTTLDKAFGKVMVQIREKGLDALARATFAREVLAIGRARGFRVLINGDAALAQTIGAAGVHLSSAELAVLDERPPFDWVGASVHSRAELERAVRLRCDFVVLGAVRDTPSHPDAAPLTWPGFAAAVQDTPIPVYAIGGMTPADLPEAISHGAHGIAMMRNWPVHS